MLKAILQIIGFSTLSPVPLDMTPISANQALEQLEGGAGQVDPMKQGARSHFGHAKHTSQMSRQGTRLLFDRSEPS